MTPQERADRIDLTPENFDKLLIRECDPIPTWGAVRARIAQAIAEAVDEVLNPVPKSNGTTQA